jgi:hypothetical protein
MVIPKGFFVSVDVKLGSTGTNPSINASVSRRNDEIKVVIDKPGKAGTMFASYICDAISNAMDTYVPEED